MQKTPIQSLHALSWLWLAVFLLVWTPQSAATAAPLDASTASFEGEDFAFLSYGKVPTWTGLASDWNREGAVHLFDSKRFPGHGEFASKGLGTGLGFRAFADRVRHPDKREYLPFFLYDLSDAEASHTWAIRVEDYSYRDSEEQLAADVIRLMKAVATHIDRPLEQGWVVLATSTKVRPNTSIAGPLREAGVEHIALSEMLEMLGASAVEVLNPGTAVGTLRFEEGGPHDIVVFRELPAHVPPVAGIITLTPQTPLSHVNLLAVNRGTPNLYAQRLALVPGLEQSMGKLVRLDADGKRIDVREVTPKWAEGWWEAHAPEPVVVPSPERGGAVLLSFASDADRATVTRVGAKAANYAVLEGALGERVRPGHALTFDAYLRTIQGTAAERIQALVDAPGADVSPALKEIRQAIRDSHVPDDVIAALRALLDAQYEGKRVRLRSSTNSEDLPTFNGAGLYLSKGFNVDESDAILRAKLGKVFASLWTDHAYAERGLYGIDHGHVAMAVLIHEAFPDEWANGVVLTQASASGLTVMVNAQRGEQSVTNPEGGAVPERFSFAAGRPEQRTSLQDSSIEAVFTGGRAEGLLRDIDVAVTEIHALLLSRQAARGDDRTYGVDIEFKIVEVRGELVLFIKQARVLAHVLPD